MEKDWRCIPPWLLDVNSKSKSVAGAHSQNCNRAKGNIIIYASWGGASDLDPNAVHLNWKKLTSAFLKYIQIYRLEKRPWISLNVRVLESVWIPSPELADLKCKLGTWAVDRCSVFHSAKSHLWGIALSYQPLPSSHIHVMYPDLGSSSHIRMPT